MLPTLAAVRSIVHPVPIVHFVVRYLVVETCLDGELVQCLVDPFGVCLMHAGAAAAGIGLPLAPSHQTE
jgi:hypothetical protein